MLCADFVKSEKLQTILILAKQYQKRPREIIGVDDPYMAYCFDEACLYIQQKQESGQNAKYWHEATFEDLYGPLPSD